MSYYIIPTGNDTQGFFELAQWGAVTASKGILFPIITLVIWIVAFMNLKQYSTSRAWAFASFLCAILTIIAAVLNLIAPIYMYLLIFLSIIGIVWLKLDNK